MKFLKAVQLSAMWGAILLIIGVMAYTLPDGENSNVAMLFTGIFLGAVGSMLTITIIEN